MLNVCVAFELDVWLLISLLLLGLVFVLWDVFICGNLLLFVGLWFDVAFLLFGFCVCALILVCLITFFGDCCRGLLISLFMFGFDLVPLFAA